MELIRFIVFGPVAKRGYPNLQLNLSRQEGKKGFWLCIMQFGSYLLLE